MYKYKKSSISRIYIALGGGTTVWDGRESNPSLFWASHRRRGCYPESFPPFPKFPPAHLGHRLPARGIVLAGVDAQVPPSLDHVENGFDGYVEFRGPPHLQLARRQLREAQLLPWPQGDP